MTVKNFLIEAAKLANIPLTADSEYDYTLTDGIFLSMASAIARWLGKDEYAMSVPSINGNTIEIFEMEGETRCLVDIKTGIASYSDEAIQSIMEMDIAEFNNKIPARIEEE